MTSQPRVVVIVVAASSGGIEALVALLAALPAGLPAAVVIVQHRMADGPSQLAKVLQRRSALRVTDAVEGGVVRPGTAYVARPDLHLTFDSQGAFRYVDGKRIRYVRSSANPLFESAARAFGRDVIAVVLTGYGADATDGVQAVHAGGGIIIAQHPAQATGMPSAAIRTGTVDHVLPLPEIAPKLVSLVSAAAA